MSTNNPLMPQGSLDGQKPKGKSNVYITVFGILAFHVVVLGAMLLQGCKNNQQNTAANSPTMNDSLLAGSSIPTNPPPMDITSTGTNPFGTATTPTGIGPLGVPNTATSTPATTTAVVPVTPVVATPGPEVMPAVAQEHTVAAKDTFATIGKKYGVSSSAIAKANPGVDSRKLRIGQKIKIPEPTAATPATVATVATDTAAPVATKVTYEVKKGDTLIRIAKNQGTTVEKIKAANNLKTTNIRLGQKLKIPAKVEAPAAPATTSPVVTPVPPATSTGYVTPLPGRTTAAL